MTRTSSRRSRTRKSRPVRKILSAVFITAVFLVCLLAAYLTYLSLQIDRRFSGMRWSLPSKVFSDTTLLYPGQTLRRGSLEKKLERLGYQKVSAPPVRKREIRRLENRWEIFLNDLNVPHATRPGFPLEIKFERDRIASMRRLDTGEPVSILELEPELLMLFFGAEREQRQLVAIREIPRHVVHAVLAAEDSRFYEHIGVDPVGIARALITNLRQGKIREGGSTITQQLAKNYFLTPERTFSRKIRELLFAVTMELTYDKDEILEIYLNEIYMGQKGSISINGLGEASHFYFGKPAASLSLEEGAVIAGLIRAPNLYSPYEDRNRCAMRRNAVLKAMQKKGWISDEEVAAALSRPIRVSGYGTYERRAPYFIDYVSRQLSRLYPADALASLGLSIYTTLDTEIQESVEAALRKGLERLPASGTRAVPREKAQGAAVVVQPKTGYILAMAGGRDYSESQFNRLTQARRQPGSAFKPFVFLRGLDIYTPASLLSNQSTAYDVEGKVWRPRNDSPVPEHQVTMRTALARSVNLATVDLAMKVGPENVIDTAVSFGFTSPMKPYPSLALGAFEIVPLELARAYCAFAADGLLPYPLPVKAVTDRNGEILEQNHMTVERVTTPARAFLINSMLRSAVEEGTGRSLKTLGIDFPVAGKTGTTNDYKDAWFVGYTPEVLALVWVGYDHGEPLPGSGSQVALPIWAQVMNDMKPNLSGEWFRVPPGVVSEEVCVTSGLLALPFRCPESRHEFFLEENPPKEHCTLHRGANPLDRVIKGVKDLFENF